MTSNVMVRLLGAMVFHSWRFGTLLSLVNPLSEALIMTNDFELD